MEVQEKKDSFIVQNPNQVDFFILKILNFQDILKLIECLRSKPNDFCWPEVILLVVIRTNFVLICISLNISKVYYMIS